MLEVEAFFRLLFNTCIEVFPCNMIMSPKHGRGEGCSRGRSALAKIAVHFESALLPKILVFALLFKVH